MNALLFPIQSVECEKNTFEKKEYRYDIKDDGIKHVVDFNGFHNNKNKNFTF